MIRFKQPIIGENGVMMFVFNVRDHTKPAQNRDGGWHD